jgi:hypothetical protein
VFSRKPLLGYKGLVFATMAITGLSMTGWARRFDPRRHARVTVLLRLMVDLAAVTLVVVGALLVSEVPPQTVFSAERLGTHPADRVGSNTARTQPSFLCLNKS